MGDITLYRLTYTTPCGFTTIMEFSSLEDAINRFEKAYNDGMDFIKVESIHPPDNNPTHPNPKVKYLLGCH
jgi:hypothetical protein